MTGDLQGLHQLMNAWAESRRTPFGTVVPKVALPVSARASIVTPVAYGTQVNLVPSNVPSNQDYMVAARPNWYLLVWGIILQTAGNGPAPNPGDVQFVIDVDRPLGVSGVGYSEKDYGVVNTTLSSFTTSWPWLTEFKHRNGEQLRIKATPIANMGIGISNFFQVALFGWEWPERGFE